MKDLFFCFLTMCGMVSTLASDAVVIVGSQLRTNVETTMHDVTDPSIGKRVFEVLFRFLSIFSKMVFDNF